MFCELLEAAKLERGSRFFLFAFVHVFFNQIYNISCFIWLFIKPSNKIYIFFFYSKFVFSVIGFIKLFYIVYLIKRSAFFSYNVYTSKLDYLNKQRYNLLAYVLGVIH